MKIGEKIKNAREDLDLIQSEVANLIPMNQSNYSKIERDMQEPSLMQLKRICEILHINPSYLLGIDEYNSVSSRDIELLQDLKNLMKKFNNQ